MGERKNLRKFVLMRHVNQFDFAALSCCIGLLPLGYWTLLIAWGRGWRILGRSYV